jgi:hypothetical protein
VKRSFGGHRQRTDPQTGQMHGQAFVLETSIAARPIQRRNLALAGRAQPTPPRAQCSGGGDLPASLQKQTEVLELDV